jgi:hypothetical protein
MQLSDLGERICILGPSNSGKSMLAEAIARDRGSQVVHLDQLYHFPNTDWEVRPTAEFVALHDAAIAGQRWVMDGNYSMNAATLPAGDGLDLIRHIHQPAYSDTTAEHYLIVKDWAPWKAAGTASNGT